MEYELLLTFSVEFGNYVGFSDPYSLPVSYGQPSPADLLPPPSCRLHLVTDVKSFHLIGI